jgi:hypothetical protein
MLSVIMLRVIMLSVNMLSVIMLSVIMLSIIILSVIMLSVIMLSVITLSVIMLSVIMLNVIMLSIIMLSVVTLSVIMLSVVVLGVIKLSVIMLSAVVLSVVVLGVIMLSVVVLNVVAPFSDSSAKLSFCSGSNSILQKNLKMQKKVFGLVIIFNYIVWTGSLSPDLPRANRFSLARLYNVNFIGLPYKTSRLRKEMNRTYCPFSSVGAGSTISNRREPRSCLG